MWKQISAGQHESFNTQDKSMEARKSRRGECWLIALAPS